MKLASICSTCLRNWRSLPLVRRSCQNTYQVSRTCVLPIAGWRSLRLGLWFLLLLWLSKAETLGARSAAAILCLAVIGSNLPHPQRYLEIPASNRAQFKAIDTMLVDDMREALQPGEQIAFLPYRNDFLVNYLAPSVPIRTYNIGGDKNLAMARENWPKTMRQFKMNKVDPAFADRLLWLLAQGEA